MQGVEGVKSDDQFIGLCMCMEALSTRGGTLVDGVLLTLVRGLSVVILYSNLATI